MTKHTSSLKKHTSLKFVFACAALFASCAITAAEPQNLQIAKNEILHYYQSGEYTHNVEQVTAQAKLFLAKKIEKVRKSNPACVQQASPKANQTQSPFQAQAAALHCPKLAVVLDIDDTALSDYGSSLELRFGGRLQDLKENEKKAQFPATPAVLDLYNFAKASGYAVFFVTGRTPDEKRATEINLRKAGFTNWDGIYYKPANYSATYHTASIFKSMTRKKLIEQGYDIVINVGDQLSDLVGGYADKNFKLPNPVYFIP
jgi:predicted secreted acid phosphatase